MVNSLWARRILRTLWSAVLGASCLVFTLATRPTAETTAVSFSLVEGTLWAGRELPLWTQRAYEPYVRFSEDLLLRPLGGPLGRGIHAPGSGSVRQPESGRLATYLVGIAGLLFIQYAGIRRMRIALASLGSWPDNTESR